jgi:phosphate/sulfate permease
MPHFFENINFHLELYGHLSAAVWLLIVLALSFDFLNGLHDAANSIATVVSTRVLTPHMAILWAAFFNFVAFVVFPLKVAQTIQGDIIDPAIVNNRVVAATLVAACSWNLLTWYWGLPTSSSHALIGGMIGAGLAHEHGSLGFLRSGLIMVLLFIVLAPLIGMLLGSAIMLAITWICRNLTPSWVDRIFRRLQLLSAAFFSLGHGGNDAQKTMGIIFVLLIAYMNVHPDLPWEGRYKLTDAAIDKKLKHDLDALPDEERSRTTNLLESLKGETQATREEYAAAVAPRLSSEDRERYLTKIVEASDNPHVPTEVVLACHLAMALGTLVGGWRIVKTMGQRIIRLRPVDGAAAETGAALVLGMTTFIKGIPISTTHTITGAIVGVGSLKRFSAVRWGVAGRVVWAWIFTIPGAAAMAAVGWWILRLVF